MFPEERRRLILERMLQGQSVKVADLSAELGVSEPTIRRDLRELEQSGRLERTHGGALPSSTLAEPSFAEKSTQRQAEKMAIARRAAEFVHDGESIILDAGTTTLEIARLLRQRRGLTVVTNSLHIAAELAGNPEIDVVVTGGVIKGNTLALVGPTAERTLQEINADRVFLGINGLDLERGLTTPTQAEAVIKRHMIHAARQVIVVTDHSKVGKVSFATVAPVERAHLVISDQRLDPAIARELIARGIQVVLA